MNIDNPRTMDGFWEEEKPESPYTKSWYVDAKFNGGLLVDGLVQHGYHGTAILQFLDAARLSFGRDRAIGIDEADAIANFSENGEAYRASKDWTIEVIAGAQDRVVELWGERSLGRFDIRGIAPRSIYKSPLK